MPEFLIPILNFVIPFTLFILISGLVYLISKKCRLIPTIFFYFFVSSVLLFVATLGLGSEYLELYENMGILIDETLLIIASPFLFVYTMFAQLIIGVSSFILEDVTLLAQFLLDDLPVIYLVAIQGVLFLLSLLMFKKKNEKNLNKSQYRD